MAEERVTEQDKDAIQYGIEDAPPWYMCLLLGFQHMMAMFIGGVSVPLVLSQAMCVDEDNLGKSEIVSTLLVTCGICTFLQVLFGVRLPIIQSGTFALLSPTISYLNLPSMKCPPIGIPPVGNETHQNITVGSPEHREIWQSRLLVIQGSVMAASVLELFLGFSGLVGRLLRHIGPLTISPTIALLGMSLGGTSAAFAAHQWWICVTTIVLLLIFSQYLGRLHVPCLGYSPDRGLHRTGYPLFKMFPVVLAVCFSWLICHVLTLTDVFPPHPGEWGYGARTDMRSDVLHNANWFRFPYPGQWGTPSFSVSLFCGLLAGILVSAVESMGDYYALARLSGAPPPPPHAINRGIAMEGIGCMLAGAIGTGNGTTSTSVNIGVVGLTKVASRRVVLYAAGFLVFCGVFSKLGALFVAVPDPVIGGSFFVLFGMIVAVGISNLQFVDMNSSRNLVIFGFSFFFGLTLPSWVGQHPEAINTGVAELDSVFTVLLSTDMFVGGTIAFILDNTIPGTPAERGLLHIQVSDDDTDDNKNEPNSLADISCYDLPFGMNYIRKVKWFSYLPFSPTYGRPPADKMAADTKSSLEGHVGGHSPQINKAFQLDSDLHRHELITEVTTI